MAGAFFESFVLSEIIKSYYNAGISEPPLYFYRDKDMNEIDLVIEENGMLHPIEIKKHADPQKSDYKAFHLLEAVPNVKVGQGGIVCLYDNLISFGEKIKVIPVKYLWYYKSVRGDIKQNYNLLEDNLFEEESE